VAGAISRRAESIFLSLPAEQGHVALNLFSRLLRVTPANDPEPDTRRRVELIRSTNARAPSCSPLWMRASWYSAGTNRLRRRQSNSRTRR
jgi:hypothetical protein